MRKGQGIVGTIDYVRPALHPGQVAVKEAMARLTLLCAGRGWRKSSLGVDVALDGLMSGEHVWWTCFTSEPIDIVINEIWRPIVFGEEVWDACYHKGDRVLFLPGCKPMRFTSLQEAKNSRGATPDRIIVDEAGMLMRGSFTSVVEPMLFKNIEGGMVLMIGTPDPDDPLNDFHAYLHKEFDPEEQDEFEADEVARFIIPVVGAEVSREGELVRKPHPYENPNYSFEKLRRSFKRTPEHQRPAWEVEYLCAFKVGGSTQIQNVERVCLLSYDPNPDVDGECVVRDFTHEGRNRYTAGMDVAIGGKYEEERRGGSKSNKENYTVISVLEEESRRQVYYRRFVPKSNTEAGRWEQVYEAIVRVHSLFPGLEWRIDVTGEGSHVPEYMMNNHQIEMEGFNFAGNANKKNTVMDDLTQWIEGSHLHLFNHPQIKKECSILRRIYREGQKPQIKAPRNENDDTPISLGLMVYGKPIRITVTVSQEMRELAAKLKAKAAEQSENVGYGSLGRSSKENSGLPTWGKL